LQELGAPVVEEAQEFLLLGGIEIEFALKEVLLRTENGKKSEACQSHARIVSVGRGLRVGGIEGSAAVSAVLWIVSAVPL
jgi:hypothetical protein